MAHNDFGYGLVTNTDVRSLQFSIEMAAAEFSGQRLRMLEVGIYDGATSRALRAFATGRAIPTENWAVDSGKEAQRPPYPECRMVWGDSSEVFTKITGGFHWIFIDGCHCVNHTMLDMLNYGDKLADGGLLLLHDTSPLSQNKKDYQGHGPKDSAAFGTATREAMEKLGLAKREDWRLVRDEWQEGVDWGGVTIFQRSAR